MSARFFRRAFDLAAVGVAAALACIACSSFIMWSDMTAFWAWHPMGRYALLSASGAAMWTRYMLKQPTGGESAIDGGRGGVG